MAHLPALIALGSSPSWPAAKNLFEYARQVAKRLLAIALETGSIVITARQALKGPELSDIMAKVDRPRPLGYSYECAVVVSVGGAIPALGARLGITGKSGEKPARSRHCEW